MSRFVTKEQWGANPSKEATEDSHPIGSTLGVTLHWEGPHMGDFPHSECAGKVRGIEEFHEYGRGWGDVAYNLIVCPHGHIFEGRGAGVRSAANGNGSTNNAWYAVCYLGGQRDGFTDAGKAGMVWAVAYLRREGNAGGRVNGHRDHKATACPGPEIYRWLNSTNFTSNYKEEPELSWNEKIANWAPQSNRPGTMRTGQALNQARGYAEDAYRNARQANAHAARTENAVRALANSLGAEVGKAVEKALKDATVEVEVNVKQGDE